MYSSLDGSSFDLLAPLFASISEGKWGYYIKHVSEEELI